MDISGFPRGITVPQARCCKCGSYFVSVFFQRGGRGRGEAPGFSACRGGEMLLVPSSKEAGLFDSSGPTQGSLCSSFLPQQGFATQAVFLQHCQWVSFPHLYTRGFQRCIPCCQLFPARPIHSLFVASSLWGPPACPCSSG